VLSKSTYSIIGSGINIDFGKTEINNMAINITSINSQGGNPFVNQRISDNDIKITYYQISKLIDTEITYERERQEDRNTLEEIKKDINSKRIPFLSLQKLKKFEKIYTMALPWVMKAIEL